VTFPVAIADTMPTATQMDAPLPVPTLSATATLTIGLGAGEEAAFRQFHAEYFDRLLRYHLVVARGDEQIAREALQETFTRVVRHARRFDEPETFWSWLTVLARSAAVDGGRRQHRYWTLLKNYTLGWLRPRATTAPEMDADARLHEHLDHSLAALPPEDRTLLETKYFSGASVRELATQTGQTEKAIESRLLRLRRQLREMILRSLHHEEKAR
jgi:RNA polymerase sigma-70 factor, ECF subfamily